LFGSGTGNVTISLYDALPIPNQGVKLLASGTVSGTANGWVDVFWENPVSVSPNTTQYLVFTSVRTDSNFGISGDAGYTYSLGQVYPGPGFGSLEDYDFASRTYAAENAVPIPAAVWLFGSGLVGLIGLKRRFTS